MQISGYTTRAMFERFNIIVRIIGGTPLSATTGVRRRLAYDGLS